MLRQLRTHILLIGGGLAVFWGLEIFDLLTPGLQLDAYGIHPRSVDGLEGILFAPALHAGLAHVAANSAPFAVLGWLILAGEVWHFAFVSAAVTLLGGLGVWLFGQTGVHLGASGLVFGYFGFLLARGLFERRAGTIVLSILIALGYGGLVFGMLPGTPGISWESHLFGFLAGVWSARYVARRARSRPGQTARASG